jgi:hypothetical protein
VEEEAQMTEAEKLQDAQDFITREVQKKSAGRTDTMNWGQGPHDAVAGIHRLVVFRGGEKSIFTFTKYELLKDYSSKQWQKGATKPCRRDSDGVLR